MTSATPASPDYFRLGLGDIVPAFGAEVNESPHRKVSHDDLRRWDDAARLLEADVRPVADDLRRQGDEQRAVRSCIDFDVLHSTMGRLDSHGEGSSWSSLAVELNHGSSVLLPGTLYELLAYARRSIRDMEAITNSTMSIAFSRAFEEFKASDNTIQNTTSRIIEHIKSVPIKSKLFFILDILRSNLMRVDLGPGQIDENIFQTAAYLLSRGSRTDKILNNRADALNFSIAVTLNSSNDYRNSRFIIISNSRAMRRLNSSLPSMMLHDGSAANSLEEIVWSPRRASIYQILLLAGGHESRGARIAWDLVQTIIQFRAHLAELRNVSDPRQLPTLNDLKLDNVFIELISSMNFVQDQINNLKRNKGTSLDFRHQKFYADDPKLLYTELSRHLNDRLRESGYLEKIVSAKRFIEQKVMIKEFGKVAAFGFIMFREITDTKDELVASAGVEDDAVTAWTSSEASLSEFVNAANLVRESIIQKLTMGTYLCSAFGGSIHDIDNILRASITILSGQNRLSVNYPAGHRFDLKRIYEHSGLDGTDVSFMRIDTGAFSVSYEGDRKAIRVTNNIYEEVSLFMGHLVPSKFKSSQLRARVYELISNDNLPSPEFS